MTERGNSSLAITIKDGMNAERTKILSLWHILFVRGGPSWRLGMHHLMRAENFLSASWDDEKRRDYCHCTLLSSSAWHHALINKKGRKEGGCPACFCYCSEMGILYLLSSVQDLGWLLTELCCHCQMRWKKKYFFERGKVGFSFTKRVCGPPDRLDRNNSMGDINQT